MEGERGGTLVLRLIESACAAGELSVGCREFPESARGLERAYQWHHARTAILAGEIAKAGRVNAPSLAMPDRLER